MRIEMGYASYTTSSGGCGSSIATTSTPNINFFANMTPGNCSTYSAAQDLEKVIDLTVSTLAQNMDVTVTSDYGLDGGAFRLKRTGKSIRYNLQLASSPNPVAWSGNPGSRNPSIVTNLGSSFKVPGDMLAPGNKFRLRNGRNAVSNIIVRFKATISAYNASHVSGYGSYCELEDGVDNSSSTGLKNVVTFSVNLIDD